MRRMTFAAVVAVAACGRIGFDSAEDLLLGLELTTPPAIASGPIGITTTRTGFALVWAEFPPDGYTGSVRFVHATAVDRITAASAPIFGLDDGENITAIAIRELASGYRVALRTTTRAVIVELDEAGQVLATIERAGVGDSAVAALAMTDTTVAMVGVSTPINMPAQVVGLEVDPQGMAVGSMTTIAPSSSDQRAPSIVHVGDGFLVAWEEGLRPRAVKTKLDGAAGISTIVVGEQLGESLEPRLTVAADRTTWIAWVDDARDEIRVIPTDDGIARWPRSALLAPQRPRTSPQFVIVTDGDGGLVSAIEGGDAVNHQIGLQRATPVMDGGPYPFAAESPADRHATEPALALGHGMIAIAYRAHGQGSIGVRLAMVPQESLP